MRTDAHRDADRDAVPDANPDVVDQQQHVDHTRDAGDPNADVDAQRALTRDPTQATVATTAIDPDGT